MDQHAFNTNAFAHIAEQGGAIWQNDPDHAVVIRFPVRFPDGDRYRSFVLPPPPAQAAKDELTAETRTLTDSAKVRLVQPTALYREPYEQLLTLARLHRQVTDIARSKDLSAAGREAKLRELHADAAAAKKLVALNATIQQANETLTATARKFYTPPRPADAVDAIEDQEIRNQFRGMSVGDRQVVVAKQLTPDFDRRVLLALMRSPAPLGLNDALQDKLAKAWGAAVVLDNPKASAELNRDLKAAQWARDVSIQVAGFAVGNQLLGRDVDYWPAVRTINGAAGFFGLNDITFEMLERRFAA